MAARVAWVLNLDADLELGAPGSYTPSRGVLAAMRRHAERLASALARPGDLVVGDETPDGAARGAIGRAFCPTPQALRALRRVGAEATPHPPLAVLRLVNGRAFCASLGPTLPGAAFVTDLDVALAMLAESPRVGAGWRLKRAYGMAGRGQRIFSAGAIADRDLRFMRAALAGGGLQIEPNVALEREFAVHGVLRARGGASLGPVLEQRCDRFGQWLATEPPRDLDATVERALLEEAERVGQALAVAGYFGPFGVDAFFYRDAANAPALCARSEINARLTMGFPASGLTLDAVASERSDARLA